MSKPRERIRAAPAPDGRAPWAWMLALALCVLTFAAYTPALDAEFVDYDDKALIVGHAAQLGGGAESLRWAFTTTEMGHWQPLTWLSWTFDVAWGGLSAETFHRTNLVLHAAGAWLLFWVALRLLEIGAPHASRTALALAAGLATFAWSVHPLRVESVAWASERRDVLSGMFLLAATWAYLRAWAPRAAAADDASGTSRRWNVAACALLVLSLLSKAWGMTFGVVLLVLDVFPLRRLSVDPRRWREPAQRAVLVQKLPYFALGACAAVISAHAQSSSPDTARTLAQWGVLERCVQAVYGLAFYVAKTAWPSDLVVLRELPYHFDASETRFVIALVCVPLAVVAIVWFARRAPALAAAAALYAIVLGPVLGFLQSGPQLVADRYSYLSCIPWSVVLAAAVLLPRASRDLQRAALATAVVLGAVLFVATRAQTRTWRDSDTLWSHALACDVPSSIAYLNRAVLLGQAGRNEDAIESLQRAVEIRPDQGRAWFTLGNRLAALGRDAEAEAAYLEATRTMVPALQPWVNLGNLYAEKLGRLDDAERAFRAAVHDAETGHPALFSPVPYLLLGLVLRRAGRDDEGRTFLERAARYPETEARARKALAAARPGGS